MAHLKGTTCLSQGPPDEYGHGDARAKRVPGEYYLHQNTLSVGCHEQDKSVLLCKQKDGLSAP